MESVYDEMYMINYLFFKSQKGMVDYINDTYDVDFANRMAKGRMLSWWHGDQVYIGVYASSPSALAHEAFHASNIVLEQRGIKADTDNDEAQAYLIGWIFSKYCENVRPGWNKSVRGR